mmetsp:Transcript_19907/g.45206  ORF Transcript_19907/g.45206 Transcript_19907/m.45206 type:complete len:353 (-) Transcript_19907:190-1248(-)
MPRTKSSLFYLLWQAIAICARDIEEKGSAASAEEIFFAYGSNVTALPAEKTSFPRPRGVDSVLASAIIGGSVAPVNRYPYVAELFPRPGCGGSLIHPRVVLTAAHCFYQQNEIATVDIGRHTRHKVLKHDRFETSVIEETYLHPSYKGFITHPDVALLLLREPSSMTPVRLSDNLSESRPGTVITAMGWGRCSNTVNCRKTSALKHAPLTMLSPAACGKFFGSRYRRRIYVCARDKAGKNADCSGDSGGPIVVRGPTPVDDVQIGVVAYGPGDCLSGPSAYANVAGLRGWIAKAMQKRWSLVLGDGLYRCKDADVKDCVKLRKKSLKIQKAQCKRKSYLRRDCKKTCEQCKR